MIKLPIWLISLALSIFPGLIAARLLLPAALLSRGHWAVGGEWLLILGVTLTAWWAIWKLTIKKTARSWQ